MKDIKIIAEDDHGLTAGQIEGALRESLGGRVARCERDDLGVNREFEYLSDSRSLNV